MSFSNETNQRSALIACLKGNSIKIRFGLKLVRWMDKLQWSQWLEQRPFIAKKFQEKYGISLNIALNMNR